MRGDTITAEGLVRLDSRLDAATYNIRRSLVKMRGVLEIERGPVPESFLGEYRERLRALHTIMADLEQVGSENESDSLTASESEKGQLV